MSRLLAVIWTSLTARARWSFWALAASLTPLQVFGFVGDSFLHHQNVAASIVSTAVLLTGLALAWRGLQPAEASSKH